MQSRHRVPTVFSIYMLDVICCALGCVILLWQVSHQEAEQQSAAAETARHDYEKAARETRSASDEVTKLSADLADAARRYDALSADLAGSRAEHAKVSKLAERRRREADRTRTALDLSEAELAKLRILLARMQESRKETVAELAAANKKLAATGKTLDAKSTALASKEKLNLDLLAQIAAAQRKIALVEKQAASQQGAADRAAKRLQEELARLEAADTKGQKLAKQLANLRIESKDTLAKLTLTEQQIKLLEQALERSKKDLASRDLRFKDLLGSHDTMSKQLLASAKELGEARGMIASLQGDKDKLQGETKKLAGKVTAIERAAEQRFAGIELTGKNVIFLVDMSGSMVLADADTRAPDKWPEVAATLAKLMRSLTGLERFQVILFSDRVQYLFGHEGRWLKYDAATTPKVVAETLKKKVTPEGDTNMSAGFAEAFRFRDFGLDTIYVLSDGLPTSGEGLPAVSNNLSAAQKTELLSRHLRTKLKNEWNARGAGRTRVRINAIGFFFESPDVGAFLWALSRENDGSFVGMSRP